MCACNGLFDCVYRYWHSTQCAAEVSRYWNFIRVWRLFISSYWGSVSPQSVQFDVFQMACQRAARPRLNTTRLDAKSPDYLLHIINKAGGNMFFADLFFNNFDILRDNNVISKQSRFKSSVVAFPHTCVITFDNGSRILCCITVFKLAWYKTHFNTFFFSIIFFEKSLFREAPRVNTVSSNRFNGFRLGDWTRSHGVAAHSLLLLDWHLFEALCPCAPFHCSRLSHWFQCPPVDYNASNRAESYCDFKDTVSSAFEWNKIT